MWWEEINIEKKNDVWMSVWETSVYISLLSKD